MAIQPIFIFSVSRSGSTLVQRVIGSHNDVATVSEPWILLPYGYTMRRYGISAEYQQKTLARAIEDFCEELPGGSDDYKTEWRGFVLRLYEKAAGEGARYFVDKTPPYCLIVEEIIGLFPEAKFVFLWRNPLSIVASIIETWAAWHPTIFRSDLFIGLPRLVGAYSAHRARAHSVQFEDLVGGDVAQWSTLMRYLEIEFEPDALTRFSQLKLNGRMAIRPGQAVLDTKLSASGEVEADTCQSASQGVVAQISALPGRGETGRHGLRRETDPARTGLTAPDRQEPPPRYWTAHRGHRQGAFPYPRT